MAANRRARGLRAGVPVGLGNFDDAPIRRVLLGATWDNTDFDVDMSVVLLDQTARVPGREYFVYRRNPFTPDRSTFIGAVSPGRSSGPDRAQILIDLDRLDPAITRAAVGFSAVQPRTTLASAGTVKTRVMDLDTGQTTLVYAHDGSLLNGVTCLRLWTIERTGDGWQVVAPGQPHPGGPPAFARDHGVVFG